MSHEQRSAHARHAAQVAMPDHSCVTAGSAARPAIPPRRHTHAAQPAGVLTRDARDSTRLDCRCTAEHSCGVVDVCARPTSGLGLARTVEGMHVPAEMVEFSARPPPPPPGVNVPEVCADSEEAGDRSGHAARLARPGPRRRRTPLRIRRARASCFSRADIKTRLVWVRGSVGTCLPA